MGDLAESRQQELKKTKICRFCLSQDAPENLTNIYSRENRIKSAPLPLQVMATVSIEVFSNDSMPSFICKECRLIFDYCYSFKQMCKKADTCLRHFPLTGIWTPAMKKPKIPIELIVKRQNEIEETPNVINRVSEPPRNLNALQASRYKADSRVVEKIEMNNESGKATLTIMTDVEQAEQQAQAVLESEIELELSKPRSPVAQRRDTPPLKKPGHKLLNKSAIRILNKEAQHVNEPRMSKPIMKRDNEGNIAVVTQILDPTDMIAEPPDPENAAVIETNVFPCPHCERSFPLRQLLEIHMVNHNRERSFNCNDCDKSFFSKYDLQKHILVHTGEKPYKCVVCPKSFTRSTLLHRHEKTHTDIPKFICVFCEKSFISQEEMEKHTERHKKNRPFSCKICQKSFAFKQGLERHEVVHCRFQPYQCQYCEQSFSTPSKLSRHLTAHAGARPYPCKLCPKSYLLSHHLSRHMRSHKNGCGSYKCNDCDKTFGTRDDLIYHSAVHATQTLVCPLCKDGFDDIEKVTDHIKQHAEGEAFACEFCDLIFMTANRLQEHTDSDHVAEMVAYNEDDQSQANAAAEKKNPSNKNTKENDTANRDIDEVIEEFLIEEFADPGVESNGETEASSIIVKEETGWQTMGQTSASSEYAPSQDDDNHSNGEESIDYLNLIEESDAAEEPATKVTKISEILQKATKNGTPAESLLRRKLAVKPPQPPSSHSNSPLTKENKKPLRKQATIIKTEVLPPPASPVTKSRQPTIQAALKGLSKSVSVKKVAAPATPPPQTYQSESKAKLLNKSLLNKSSISVKMEPPKTEVKPDQQSSTKQSPQTRLLRQRSETSPTKPSPSASPSPSPSPSVDTIKKFPAASLKKIAGPAASDVGDKKIVEMMIGDKKVKVQRITMSKAQAAAMAREGRIEMKQGTMILKKGKT